MKEFLRLSRRIGIAIAGGLVITAGVAMLVLPGPGLVVMALGLAILSLEFERPRIWLAHIKARGLVWKQRIVAWLARTKARAVALKQRIARRRNSRKD